MKDYKNVPGFCLLPFTTLSTRNSGGAKVCSEATNSSLIKKIASEEMHDHITAGYPMYNLTRDPVEQLWNSRFLKTFRMNRIDGKYSPFCETCYQQEAVGIESKRQIVLNKHYEKYKHLVEEADKNEGAISTMPVWWELRVSDVCNEACRYCVPHSSDKMRKEYTAIHDQLTPALQEVTNQANLNIKKFGELGSNQSFKDTFYNNLKDISVIELHGGEPTANKHTMDIIDHVVDSGHAAHIHMIIHTNIHAIKPRHIETWQKFKSGWIGISIDAFAEENEYIRHGSSWAKIEENLKLFKQFDYNWNIILTGTASVYNSCTMHRYVEWFMNYTKENNINNLILSMQQLIEPEMMRLEHVPEHMRSAAIEHLHKLIGHELSNENIDNVLNDMIRMLSSKYVPKDGSYDDLLKMTAVLDKNRNQHVLDVFPHLEIIFKNT
jgi:hypothetical protein